LPECGTLPHPPVRPGGPGRLRQPHRGPPRLAAVRLTVVALVVSLVLLWFGLLGYVGRSLFAGGPILQQASGLIVIPVILAALAGLIALCERLARPEAAHLRAWLTGRLDVPAPPPRTAPVPRPPAPPPAVRPPIPT
jgi:hypothetical protein